jgi:hypothetical protein
MVSLRASQMSSSQLTQHSMDGRRFFDGERVIVISVNNRGVARVWERLEDRPGERLSMRLVTQRYRGQKMG